ncbi:putative winged helix-turn-helix DNA-binding domain, CDT1 Geminin-binding domain-containing protein [Rosa chinensis]|uniref:Putative winged helix-turn-helix DNA-binding domain, CDT1 Geminin-binding domain-containing protein n=1 Tax=Rosa chinensis TaxID=74649 RepID=A0A2P6PVD4_ROSCH|nr:CDT1-like protein a, chloroplastic [Rosa chinensis]PRQ25878.1 putative winged helix-turn-helix DNA-binding domain, CDT1 Geminin-binding domain-containing protein [Rosa chinensis]
MSSSETQEGSDLALKFKSKKPLTQTKPQSVEKDPILTAPTPEKTLQPAPPRARNRNFALSIGEIRRAAAKSVGEKKEQIGSARRQIAWPEENPKKARVGAPKKLPEKFEMLGEFFNCLDSSIRLLRSKGLKTSFRNICPAVEDLTDRRFTYSHLAQMKFILPEVIEIKKVLVLDERTSCLKPDLHVALNVQALENDGKSKSEGGGIVQLKKTLNLRRVFRDRLVQVSRSYPEDYEIPEETLPHPFNCGKQDIHRVKFSSSSSPGEVSTDVDTVEQPAVFKTCLQGDEIPDETHQTPSNQSMEDLNFNIIRTPSVPLPIKTSFEAPKNQQPEIASHLSLSFRRHFSQKAKHSESENIQDDPPKASLRASNLSVSESNLNTVCSVKEDDIAASSHGQVLNTVCSVMEDSIAASSHRQVLATPTKKIDPLEDDGLPGNNTAIQSAPGKLASTPAKLVSSPAKLMSITPAPHPPKRCFMSPEDSSLNKLVRRPPRTRSLKFDTPVKSRNAEDEVLDTDEASMDKDILDILPRDLLQSLRDKERKATEERNPAISQAKRRQKMIANLPKLFNMIHFLVQSMNRSFITKQELVHKIIWNHCDMIDRKDVEEQLNLLLELVPDWISEKKLGGDLLFNINKRSCPEAIRSRLEEAN